MKVKEDDTGWTISLEDGQVYMIQIDFRLGLLIVEDQDDVQIHIGQPCRLKNGATEVLLVPNKTTSLAAILPYFWAHVDAIRMGKDGSLRIAFRQGASLDVGPHPEYEAWEAGCRVQNQGYRIVSTPGGEISIFGGESKRWPP